MSGLAAMLVELAGSDQADLRAIEYELALAQRAAAHTRRGQIPWARHFPWLRDRLGEAQNHRCCWCGKRMNETGLGDDRPTFEHVTPLSRGGEDTPANLAIACLRCNHDRGSDEAPPFTIMPLDLASAAPG